MNKSVSILLLIAVFSFVSVAQKKTIVHISTTESNPWKVIKTSSTSNSKKTADAEIFVNKPLQSIEGFGACFNELGWTSLGLLSDTDRKAIIKEMFQPNTGANFTICRMPLGANDFSRDWYSYNETDGDFGMEFFSIKNDSETLLPFIKSALAYNQNLKVWASPWSPPTWMKYNKHYACRPSEPELAEKFKNNLLPYQLGKEGSNMFIQDARYFEAYSLYFSKFITAYRAEGINISTVMPQNEFNSCQIFPSCTWASQGLSTFIGKYLGPKMEKLGVEIMHGTMERPNAALVDSVLKDPASAKFIQGVGFQWAGKSAVGDIHSSYPNLKLYQTEQECGDGKNDWKHTVHAWELMKHYFRNGVSAYMYWNISLEDGGYSRWGWQQNSLVTVYPKTKTFKYNSEYYLMKHASHFVQQGAKLLSTTGAFENLLAFENPDKSIVIIAHNNTNSESKLSVKVGSSFVNSKLEANSFNTFVLK